MTMGDIENYTFTRSQIHTFTHFIYKFNEAGTFFFAVSKKCADPPPPSVRSHVYTFTRSHIFLSEETLRNRQFYYFLLTKLIILLFSVFVKKVMWVCYFRCHIFFSVKIMWTCERVNVWMCNFLCHPLCVVNLRHYNRACLR